MAIEDMNNEASAALVLCAPVGIGGRVEMSILARRGSIPESDPDFLDRLAFGQEKAGIWVLTDIGGNGGYDGHAEEYWSEYYGNWLPGTLEDIAEFGLAAADLEAEIVDFHDGVNVPDDCLTAYLMMAQFPASATGRK